LGWGRSARPVDKYQKQGQGRCQADDRVAKAAQLAGPLLTGLSLLFKYFFSSLVAGQPGGPLARQVGLQAGPQLGLCVQSLFELLLRFPLHLFVEVAVKLFFQREAFY
jgi:hypothetical protein